MRTRVACIVENVTGNTLIYTIWSLRSVPMLSVGSSQLLKVASFPFPTVKILYDMQRLPSINYNSARSLRGYILTNHTMQPLLHVAAYIRGRIGPLATDIPGVGPDGFAWIMTLNPNADIPESSIAQIQEFIGEPTAAFTQCSNATPEQMDAVCTCTCAIS